MKAAYVYESEKMDIRELPVPQAGAGEALIEIVYAGVCGSDITMYRGQHPTARLPVVLGHEVFGIVREINAPKGATQSGGASGSHTSGSHASGGIRPGDRVAAEPLLFCGECEACRQGFGNVCGKLRLLGLHLNGAYAQYVTAGVEKLVPIRTDIPDKLAALAEPFAVAYHVCARAGLRVGDDALIIGGGPIGNVVAVMAKAAGANVTVSEPNPVRRATVEALGLPSIDPVNGDMDELVAKKTGGAGFDVVIESSGSKAGILSTTALCKIHGTIVPMALAGTPVDFVLGQVSFKEQTVVGSRVYPFLHFKRGVETLEKLYADGRQPLDPLISDIMPLGEAQKAVDMMIAGQNACKILLDAKK